MPDADKRCIISFKYGNIKQSNLIEKKIRMVVARGLEGKGNAEVMIKRHKVSVT